MPREGLPSIGRRGMLVGATGLLAAPAIVHAQGQNGVALVIGNSKYKWEASLPNVKRDVSDIATSFQALGLRTELLQDANLGAMRTAIDRFTAAARGSNFAAFYFAGHGASWDKDTYLVPEDADLGDPRALRNLVSVSAVTAAVKDARRRLLVFDNCRNNPADGWRQEEAKNMARVDAPGKVAGELSERDTLVLFSTAAGGIALDGPPGENSPFAAALLRQLNKPSVDMRSLPSTLRRDLLLATESRQMAWDYSSYADQFLLNGTIQSVANRGPTYDPSRVVELPNAYAFVSKNGLTLPSGLVACRPAGNPPYARMVGSYSYELMSAVNATSGFTYPTQAINIVLSVSDPNIVVSVQANKDWGSGQGASWRFSNSERRENGFVTYSVNGRTRFDWVWGDRNSASYFTKGTGKTTGADGITTPRPLVRLDG